MANNCTNKNCAHFIDQKVLHLYRNKFVCFIILTTIVVAVLFWYCGRSYKSSLDTITSAHKKYIEHFSKSITPLKMSKDSCVYANEQLVLSMKEHMQTTQSLLEIQSTKIQSDFVILSLWAGILMIIFLIFSIYSIFKTDELLKQSKDGLRKIEEVNQRADDNIKSIDEKVKEEIQKVSKAADAQITTLADETSKSIETLKSSIEDENSKFAKIVDEKTNDFENVYNKFLQELESAKENQKQLFDIFYQNVLSIQKSSESEQETKDTNDSLE